MTFRWIHDGVRRLAVRTWQVPALVLALSGCRAHKPPPRHEDSVEPSPNASILPAPLASGTELLPHLVPRRRDGGGLGLPADSAGRLLFGDAGRPPPTPMRSDQALPRDTLTLRDESGVTLNARWVWANDPPAPAEPDLDKQGLKHALDKTALTVVIDLAQAGRMRLVLDSPAFPLPAGSELRARLDHYGQALVWPNGRMYRVLPPGSLRAIFAERRTDVLPLVPGKSRPTGRGKLLGFETARTELSSAFGSLTLEQAHVGGTGPSGDLLCRLLVELIAVEPSTPVCTHEIVPLSAHYRWAGGGQLAFQVNGISHLQDLPLGNIYVPPAGGQFDPNELPPQASGVLLSRASLSGLRTRDARAGAPSKDAPREGLTAVNHTDTLRYLLLDGVPIAWVRPRSSQRVIGTKPGRYSVSWRDFFGTTLTAPHVVQLPAVLEVGAKDAGSERTH